MNAIDPSGLYIVYTAASIDVFRGIGGGADVALYKDNVTGESGIAISGHVGVGYDVEAGIQLGATDNSGSFDGGFIEAEGGIITNVNIRASRDGVSVSNTWGYDYKNSEIKAGGHISIGWGKHFCIANCSDFYSLDPSVFYSDKGF